MEIGRRKRNKAGGTVPTPPPPGYAEFAVVRQLIQDEDAESKHPILNDVSCIDDYTLKGTKAVPPTRLWGVDLTQCKTLVLPVANLQLIEGKIDYGIDCFVAIRTTVFSELEGIDSMLRVNERESLKRREDSIDAFTLAAKENGYIFFWKLVMRGRQAKQRCALYNVAAVTYCPTRIFAFICNALSWGKWLVYVLQNRICLCSTTNTESEPAIPLVGLSAVRKYVTF